MRYFLFVIILVTCGVIGYHVKNKYKKQNDMLVYLYDFVEYLHINVLIYKNNISEIINNYLIQQNNKNAKFNNLFQKNSKISSINPDFLDNNIFDENIKSNIKTFMLNLGKSELRHECEKIAEFKNILKSQIDKTRVEIKSKGDLYFKIWLSIGLVIDIVLW